MTPLTEDPLLAPRWHTSALVALYLMVAVTGLVARAQGVSAAAPAATSRLVGAYLPLVLVQAGLVVYVCRVGRRRNALRSLIGAWPSTWTSALTDLALAGCGWIAIRSVELASARIFPGALGASVSTMLPQTPLECLAWTVVAMVVGAGEEIVFRGYLQTQLGAFTRRASVGIVLQAALFGLAHAEQGALTALRIGIYGLGLGVLVRWRRSLVPAILCHVATDLASGWVAAAR